MILVKLKTKQHICQKRKFGSVVPDKQTFFVALRTCFNFFFFFFQGLKEVQYHTDMSHKKQTTFQQTALKKDNDIKQKDIFTAGLHL